MEDITKYNVNYSLINHQLISCNAESKIIAKPGLGGAVEFAISIETPTSPDTLKAGDTFSLTIILETTGTNIKDKTQMFSVVCKIAGTYQIFTCPECGIITANNNNFWSVASGQLLPLVSQYTSDILSRMGFKNILVPSHVPVSIAKPAKPITRKKKTT